MAASPKLAAEDFLQPIERFNYVVGPLFAELKHRFPLDDEHTDCGLARSLGVFLEHCFVTAVTGLERLKPTPMTNDEWMVATEEQKQPHLHWQRNLKYLKHRRKHFVDLMGYRQHGKDRGDENEACWLA